MKAMKMAGRRFLRISRVYLSTAVIIFLFVQGFSALTYIVGPDENCFDRSGDLLDSDYCRNEPFFKDGEEIRFWVGVFVIPVGYIGIYSIFTTVMLSMRALRIKKARTPKNSKKLKIQMGFEEVADKLQIPILNKAETKNFGLGWRGIYGEFRKGKFIQKEKGEYALIWRDLANFSRQKDKLMEDSEDTCIWWMSKFTEFALVRGLDHW